MAYEYGNREQITFLPDSIEKYVLEDDPVRAYDAFIDALGANSLGLSIEPDKTNDRRSGVLNLYNLCFIKICGSILYYEIKCPQEA